ncbi:Formate dehydrogenase H, selenocysteine-containing [Salmonella enterica subsp. enterica]|uniref:Formate dehydrogenase H, selenocysteine-containing n=1 Tax=Salmonella enterica I TaxID=59201 RepID=A0A3S4K3M3_SALET|nr:Formate dehydrogenase H, selenocysteine-containing [Salmonella enterica subsp. enterica]
MSNAINEIDNTDLVFVFGYNPADSHPIVANHVINAKRNGGENYRLRSAQKLKPRASLTCISR